MNWPDCKEPQCNQAHLILDGLSEVLGIQNDKDRLLVTKAVFVIEAIKKLRKNQKEKQIEQQ